MQNITTTQKEHLYEGGHVGVTVTGETLDGDPIALTEDDIIEGSFSIDRNWTSGGTVEIGCAETSELIFELDNTDGRWSAIRWEGARLTVAWDIDGEPLQAGIFTVDEPPRKLTTMTIRALDDMARFNRPYEPGITYPASLTQILIDCCAQCNVNLHTLDFTNGDYVVSRVPEGDDITFHHVVGWIAELAGCCAWIDELARLRLSWYGDQQQATPELSFSRPSPAIHPETGEEIGVDQPIFVNFADGKKGLWVEEGTENLIPDAFDGPFLGSTAHGAGTNLELEYDIGLHGSSVRRAMKSDSMAESRIAATSTKLAMSLGRDFPGQTLTFSAYVRAYGASAIGKNMDMQIYDGKSFSAKGDTLEASWKRVSVTKTFHAEANNLYIYVRAPHADFDIGDGFEVCLPQLEIKSYPTSFSDGIRASSTTSLALADGLDFGIGLSFKPSLPSSAKPITLWHAGAVRCYYDTADERLKLAYGAVEAEIEATWEPGDIIGVYGGRKDGKVFLQGKVAGEMTEKVETGYGENLLLNGDFSKGLDGWESWGTANREIVNINNKKWLHISQDDEELFRGIRKTNLTFFEKDTDFTISFTAFKAEDSESIARVLLHQAGDGNYQPQPNKTFKLTDTPADYSFTFRSVNNEDKKYFTLMIGGEYALPFDIYLTNIKFEKGSTPTPWTPAPEDETADTLFIGSSEESEGHPNAVVADFSFDTGQDIDPRRYLRGVGDGGGGDS